MEITLLKDLKIDFYGCTFTLKNYKSYCNRNINSSLFWVLLFKVNS